MAVDFWSSRASELQGTAMDMNSQSIQMTHGTSFEDIFANPSIMDGFNGLSIILQLGFFLLFAYFQYMLSKKLEVKYSWMAWIPLLSFFNKLWIAWKTVNWWLKWFILPVLMMILVGVLAWISGNEWIGMIGVFILVIVLVVGTVKLNHGVSIRTGHSGWWTAGLMFAGWLFWPVTALHYEKGDEVTPRPFTGWKKGLLIFFALWFPILMIFGILAAAIYPAMNGYLERSRDVARISHMWQISTGLSSYYADMETYPSTPESGCFSDKVLSSSYTYTTNKLADPSLTNITPGCDGSDGTYAYRGHIKDGGNPAYTVIWVKMEDKKSWNSSLPIDDITPDTPLIKWSGQYYYVVR